MYYYKKTCGTNLEIETVCGVVMSCCQKLNIKIPQISFIEETENQAESILQHNIQGSGFANTLKRAIYITLPMDLYSMIKTTAHECWHIHEGDNNITVSEENAELFAEIFRKEFLK